MLMIAATSFAQQQMATLNHNDTISVFYGAYALRDAHNAAVAGDIVTLSPGTFNNCNISKPITLRGAGAAIDTISDTYPTIITGQFTIDIPENQEYYLTMEGILINERVTVSKLYNAKFIRCNMYQWYSSYPIFVNENIEIINCYIKHFSGNTYTSSSDFTFVNTVVYYSHHRDIPVLFINSMVLLNSNCTQASAYNSIITRPNTYNSRFESTSSAYNCIFIKNGNSGSIYDNVLNITTNAIYNNLNEVFETWHSFTNYNSLSFDERYILKEEIATSFLGSDGTEVGIHGGMFPFDTRPSYIVVKKCNVANKSTIDGKLSVDIEVMVEE